MNLHLGGEQMLTAMDFQRVLESAPELRYIDDTWPVYESYVLCEGDRGTYVCAPYMHVVENSLGTGPAYTANKTRGFGSEGEYFERLFGYFQARYRRYIRGGVREYRSAEEQMADFLIEFARKSYEAVDKAGKASLHTWFRKECLDSEPTDKDSKEPKLDKTDVDHLYHHFAEEFDQLDEDTAAKLALLYQQVIKAYRIGGQDRMFRRLRKLFGNFDNQETKRRLKRLRQRYAGVEDERLRVMARPSRQCFARVDAQEIERLIADIRSDFDRGANVHQALSRVVFVDEHGGAEPGPFTRRILFNIRNDIFRRYARSCLELITNRKNAPRDFYPLSSPSLFLQFAELGGREISEDDVMEWVHRYGILGLSLRDSKGDRLLSYCGGPEETVAAFVREAEEANWIKRVYEAALRLGEADDTEAVKAVEELRELFGWSVYARISPREAQEKALEAVRQQVQDCLGRHCSVRWRQSGEGFTEFLDFKNVMGAMYLQFAWVLREKAIARRCKYCGKLIPESTGAETGDEKKSRKTHKNKDYCNRTCKDAYRYEQGRRRRGQRDLVLSLPAATREEFERLATIRGLDAETLLAELIRAYKEQSPDD
jgi:hypothetical protein